MMKRGKAKCTPQQELLKGYGDGKKTKKGNGKGSRKKGY